MFWKKAKKDTRIDDAIRERERLNMPRIRELQPSAAQIPGLERIRFENIQKELGDAPSIATVTRASVTRTSDTGEPVILLETVDGKRYTLWLTHSDQVRSITHY